MTEAYRLVLPSVIALLVLWLIFRIKKNIKRIVRDEIYDAFPNIKEEAQNLGQRIENISAKAEVLEGKLAKLAQDLKKK